MQPSPSRLVVPSLKPLVVIVGVLRMFLILDLYHLDRNKFHQECIIPVGLHLNLQYPSTIRDGSFGLVVLFNFFCYYNFPQWGFVCGFQCSGVGLLFSDEGST